MSSLLRSMLLVLLIVTMQTWRVQARDEVFSDKSDNDSDIAESDSGTDEDPDSSEGRRTFN
jgi:hypothetical protein